MSNTEALIPRAVNEAVDKWCGKLAVAFQRQIDVGTIKVYREALADLPTWAIEAGGLALIRKGGDFFPTAAKWHAAAEDALEQQRKALIATPAKSVHECETCRDTGWADVEKDGKSYVVPCTCRPWNGQYQKMTASSRKGANEEVK